MNLFKYLLKILKNKEVLVQILLFLILFIFLLPFLTGQGGLCYDDAAFISFPRLIAAARAFQNGEVPLWDSNEYCGAKPFYTMMESPVYNIIFYPLFFMADTENLDQSFLVLYILPFILLTIFSGFGTYYFFRKAVKSNELVSLVCGVAYALNPSMALSNLSLINTFVFAYIPWILLSIAKFLETHKFKWWLSGIIFFVLLNTSYNLNYTFRIYFFISFITLILFIWYLKQNWKNYLYIIYTISIFIIAVGLTAFVWAGIIEGLSWITEDVSGKFSESINDMTNSVQPG
ncbi:MAG: hypothetical protein JXB50_02875, partial [Spirochaetes bacterium]|nr:hypothetical protein [Spirochaetota bacterium]